MYDLITLNDAELPDLISCQLVKSLKILEINCHHNLVVLESICKISNWCVCVWGGMGERAYMWRKTAFSVGFLLL